MVDGSDFYRVSHKKPKRTCITEMKQSNSFGKDASIIAYAECLKQVFGVQLSSLIISETVQFF